LTWHAHGPGRESQDVRRTALQRVDLAPTGEIEFGSTLLRAIHRSKPTVPLAEARSTRQLAARNGGPNVRRTGATHIDSTRSWRLGSIAIGLLFAAHAGCASGTAELQPSPSDRHVDTLAVIPFGPKEVRTAICDALSSEAHAYTVAIQPETETDARLEAAGWTPSRDLSRIKTSSLYYGIHHIETDSSAFLSRLSGARFVMVGDVRTYGMAFSATYEGVDLDVAIYDGRSGKRIWAYRDGGFAKELSSPEALRQRVGARIAGRLPFTRR
jgi:hypothetical protein